MQKQAQFDDRIRNLIALAQDGSKHSRTLLFSHICDLFLQRRPMASATQVRMLTEILKELLNQVERATRQDIVTALCALASPPIELTDIMCEDIVEVSGPLLEKAILPDEKLIHLIRYGTEAHRIHISRRFGLSPLVRRELETAQQDSQSSKLKYSLNELEKLADDQNPDLDEETTANILELLRAQNIHKEYTGEKSASEEEHPPLSRPDHITPEPHEPRTPPVSVFANIRPSDEDPVPENTSPAAPSTHAPSFHEPSFHEPVFKDGGDPFPAGKVANDAILPRSFTPPQPILHMEEAACDLTLDIQQDVQDAREETQRQRTLVRSVADWFWEVDRRGAISFLSEEAFTVFGQPVQSLIGEDMISLCGVPESGPGQAAAAAESFETLFERRVSFRNIPFYIESRQSDKSLWYMSAIAIFDIATGRFTGFRGSARADSQDGQLPHGTDKLPPVFPSDEHRPQTTTHSASNAAPVTGLKTAQQEIPRSDMAAPEPQVDTNCPATESPHEEVAAELLHNLSHEFRTPLNAIIGFSEMIDMEAWGPVNDQYHKNTKSILAAAVQLKEAVNDVLDSAKLEAGLMQINPESFSLKAVLKECQENVAPMARDMKVDLLDNDNNIDVILYNDKQSVELCLTKILTSTLKRATPGEMFSPSVLINSNAQVRIEIPLLGPRIDEEDASKLFEKLQKEPAVPQNSPQNGLNYAPKISTGFGLSIAQSLAHMIGGEISPHISQGKVSHLVLTLSNHDLPK